MPGGRSGTANAVSVLHIVSCAFLVAQTSRDGRDGDSETKGMVLAPRLQSEHVECFALSSRRGPPTHHSKANALETVQRLRSSSLCGVVCLSGRSNPGSSARIISYDHHLMRATTQ